MHAPAFLSRLSSYGLAGRWLAGAYLRRAWGRFNEYCDRLERSTEPVLGSYAEMWRRGWPWWPPAVLLAPVALVTLVVLAVVVVAVRLTGLGVAAAILLVVAVVAAAPIAGVAWVATSFVAEQARTAPRGAAVTCDSSYPEWCVPVGADDLDCRGRGTAPYAPIWNFAVRGADVHDLDRDDDGIGCEHPSNGRP